MRNISDWLTAVINSPKISRASASRLEDITFAPGYAEIGYDDPPSGIIAVGNWNNAHIRNPDYNPGLPYSDENECWIKADDYVSRVASVLEKRYKAELEWSDEWCACSECGKIFRTSANCHGWTASYVEIGGEFICRLCAAERASDVLEEFEGKSRKALSRDLGIDPALHGYIKILDGLENGLHEHMAADPKVIAKELKNMGVHRYLFTLDNTSMFHVSFSCWVHEDDIAADAIHSAQRIRTDADVSQADILKRALAACSRAMRKAGKKPGAGYVLIHKAQPNGKIKSKWVSPEDFIAGKALE